MGCLLGFKYVPPADTKSADTSSSSSLISTRQSCVQCRRSFEDQQDDTSVFSRAFSGGKPSPRFLWPESSATTAATTTTTTTAPCCTGELKNATGCGQENTRIVGGQDATENEFPWQCGILTSENIFYGCGATIINCDPVIIVSAAHCFQGSDASPNGKKVSCGAHMMGDQSAAAPSDTNEERLTITEIINHPNYNDATFDNDIAVIKVNGTFTCGQNIYPACLPNTNSYEYVGWNDTIVSGWGTLSSGGVLSDTLQWVKVPPVSRTTCNQASSYNGQITSNMICAGLAAGGKDACQGDSGGPLASKGAGVDTGYSLIGVVSWGNGCASASYYGVYAKVSNYLSWIAQQYDLSFS